MAKDSKKVRVTLVGITANGFEKQLATCCLEDDYLYGDDTQGISVEYDNKKIVFDLTALPEELKVVEVRITEGW